MKSEEPAGVPPARKVVSLSVVSVTANEFGAGRRRDDVGIRGQRAFGEVPVN